MFKFSWPRLSRFSPIFLLLVFILLILAAEGGYYYYLKVIRKPALPPSETRRGVEEKAEKGEGEYENLKQEIKAQQEGTRERSILFEKCFQFYLENPKGGTYRLDKIGNNVFDYFYRGRLTKVEEKEEKGCLYTSLLLEGVNNFTLVLPSDFSAKTDLGNVYPAIYKDHLNQKIEVKIRYEQSPADPKAFKLLEWQPLVFFID